MWLPAAGSLHTVVLLTPGKCAARWICLRGIGGASSGAERRSGWRDGAARTGPRRVSASYAGAEGAAPLQLAAPARG